MAKAEISWKRRTPEGAKLQVYVQHTGGHYRFHVRERRFDQWQPLEAPPLEDWLKLLDAVQRRVQRRRLTPKDEERLIRTIRERFPEHEF